MIDLEKFYNRQIQLKNRFLKIAITLFVIATLSLSGFIALYVTGYDVLLIPELIEGIYLTMLLIDLFSTLTSIGLVMLIFSTLVFARRARIAKMMMQQNRTVDIDRVVVTTDVKPVEKEPQVNKYQTIIDQYKKLYEQGLISKEDYLAKKKELEN